MFNTVKNLQKRSSAVVDVFTKTITDLTKVNDKIAVVKANRLAKAAKIQNEVLLLDEQEGNNTALINKFTKMLS